MPTSKYPQVVWISIGLAVACQLDRQGRMADARIDGGTDAADSTALDGANPDATSDTSIDVDSDSSLDSTAPSDAQLDASADAGMCSFSQPQCDGNDLLTCEAAGVQRAACPLGCRTNASGGHCADVVPSNVETEISNPWAGTYDLVVGAGQELLLRTAANELTAMAGGSPIGGPVFNTVHDNAHNTDYTVVRLRSLTIRSGGTLWVRGYQPAIFLVSGNVSIENGGRLLAGASEFAFANDRPPPGGGIGGNAGDNSAQSGEPGSPASAGGGGGGTHGDNGRDSGGAGGSFGTRGGRGGDGTTGAGTDERGGRESAAAFNANLIPLRGGGGGGGAGNNDGGRGGHGGGALQISSANSISVASGALIDSSGEGGRGGRGAGGDAGGGGGGGAGGAILLEAPTVSVAGIVSVIGGAGGRGMHPNGGSAGMNGVDGLAGYAPPLLAMGIQYAPATPGTGDGGEGGQSSQAGAAATDAADGDSALNGGGGGGGTGVIHIRTRDGTFAAPSASLQSGLYPPISRGASNSAIVID